jgi:hypothetical protein
MSAINDLTEQEQRLIAADSLRLIRAEWCRLALMSTEWS